MKTCGKCKLEKSIESFCKSSRRKDGLQLWCKACNAIASQKWKDRHPEMYKAGMRRGIEKDKVRYSSDAEYREKKKQNGYAWRRKNRDRVLVMDRHSRLLREYGISQDDYDRMLAAQGGKCACCREVDERTLHVDHEHNAGKRVRGLLCTSCNTGIGKLGDSIAGLQRAIDYLRASEPVVRGPILFTA